MEVWLGIDPGTTTGFALYKPKTDEWEHWQQTQERITDDLHICTPEIIIIERFTFQPRTKLELVAKEIIGVCREWARVNTVEFREQTPAMAKNLFTDDKLKALNLWDGVPKHARDATRHVLYYATVTRQDMRFVQKLGRGTS